MPGIIAVLARKATGNPQEIAEDIADLMYGSESFCRYSVNEFEGLSLVVLHNRKDSHGAIQNQDWLIAWYGRPFYRGKAITEEILTDFEASSGDGTLYGLISQFSGHFQLIIYSRRNHELLCTSDKISTHPSYYTATDECAVISPEILSLRALAKYGWTPSVREGAIYEFMASGHLWGDGTFWDEVLRVGPGQFITCTASGIVCRFYWTMRYTPSHEETSKMVSGLYEAVQKDLEFLPPGRGLLTLSGGSDSRSLLGFLHSRNQPFSVISYNFGDVYTESDAHVGMYFARKLGVHHFYSDADLTDSGRLIDDINRTVRATGGECDTTASQDAFLGAQFYADLAKEYDFLIRGDEAWGGHFHATRTEIAFLDCYLYNLNEFPQPEKILKADCYRQGVRYLQEQRERYAEEYRSASSDLNDLRDYLHWRHREPRLLQNMAYFRRVYIPHTAPFLLDNTLAMDTIIPSRYRTGKRLFMDMNRVQFPDLFLDPNMPNPYMTAGTRFDRIYQSEEIQDFIRDALGRNLPESLKSVIDPEKMEYWVHSVMASRPAHIRAQNRSYNILRFFRDLLEWNKTLSSYLEFLLVRSGIVKYPFLDSKYLFRMLVLSLALREHESALSTAESEEKSAPLFPRSSSDGLTEKYQKVTVDGTVGVEVEDR